LQTRWEKTRKNPSEEEKRGRKRGREPPWRHALVFMSSTSNSPLRRRRRRGRKEKNAKGRKKRGRGELKRSLLPFVSIALTVPESGIKEGGQVEKIHGKRKEGGKSRNRKDPRARIAVRPFDLLAVCQASSSFPATSPGNGGEGEGKKILKEKEGGGGTSRPERSTSFAISSTFPSRHVAS